MLVTVYSLSLEEADTALGVQTQIYIPVTCDWRFTMNLGRKN